MVGKTTEIDRARSSPVIMANDGLHCLIRLAQVPELDQSILRARD